MFGLGRRKKTKAKSQRQAVRAIRATYDAAKTTDENSRHWLNADGLNASGANSISVRQLLRNRARYEVANNTYARGIVNTLGNHTIGTGPTLALDTGNPEDDKQVVAAFSQWAKQVALAEKLRRMRMARAESGEAFLMYTTNGALPGRVKLDVRLIEADQIAHPNTPALDANHVDGLEFDQFGNVGHYHLLKSHPGSNIGNAYGDSDKIAASQMLHYFRPTRPGEWRGVPDLTPALPLFAQLRRYTLATITAAETAAAFAAVIQTDAAPDGDEDEFEAFDAVELERNMATTLPAGWKLGQMKAEHPTTTYKEFKGEILGEIARVIDMPYNIAAGNSSAYNYASGRMDHQAYFVGIDVERCDIENKILDPIFVAFHAEAARISGVLPQRHRTTKQLGHAWHWPGHEHVDPAKEATGQSLRLASNTTTLAAEYAKQGKDWEREIRQRAKELDLMRELGITPEEAAPEMSSSNGADDHAE